MGRNQHTGQTKAHPATAAAVAMRRMLSLAVVAVLVAGIGCASTHPTADRADQPAWEWPLRFTAHNFSAGCFDTRSCTINYMGRNHIDKQDSSPSVASYGRPFERLFDSRRIAIRNFPPPARVTWRSSDGAPLQAEVDMAEIFKDGLIRHNLRKDEISEIGSIPSPDIILEVNDRTINVYMRAFISTKVLQRPGNRHSDFRNDMIKAYSRTY